ncbi:FMN-binding protein [uncultured Adlercreutzia sp.]|uniref:FMN-binding protein n=1 Tax=uncultured Adlercreutzia sp. TaxID=875803 RepID=UPI0026743ED8|nr:FMN-binding protein [uncultured Adlercreutzia sp.]
MNGVKTTAALGCATVLTFGLAGCGASFEGSGSKDAASAEQLAQRTEDPWAAEVVADGAARAEGNLRDGVYTGYGRGMEGWISVTLLVDDGRLTCLETAQDGESQSRGGYEAIRDGVYAEMIEAAQGPDIDAVAGATITTAGVKQAVEDALAQAAAEDAVAAAADATTAEKEAGSHE